MTDVKDITLAVAQPLKAVFQQGADREAKIPLKPMLSKGENVYWTVPGSRGMFGLAVVPPKGFTDLPNRVVLETLNGVQASHETVQLERGLTKDNRPRVHGSKVVTIPFKDGKTEGIVERLLQVSISVTKTGNWQVKASCIGIGGGGQEAVVLFE